MFKPRQLAAACTLGASLLLMSPAQAGLQVLDVELGVSTVEQVRQAAARWGEVIDFGVNASTQGHMLAVTSPPAAFQNAQSVLYVFDAAGKLRGVNVYLRKGQFDELAAQLGQQYRVVGIDKPGSDRVAIYTSDGAVISLTDSADDQSTRLLFMTR